MFDGFGPMPGAPNNHDEHALDLLSDNTRDIAPVEALDLNLGQIASPEDGWMDPAREAAHSSAVEPNTVFIPKEACVSGSLDLCPAVGPRPRVPEPADSGWAPVMEFAATDIFQHSPFGDMLNSLKSLSLSGDSWPNYVQLKGEEGDEEINRRSPPTS